MKFVDPDGREWENPEQAQQLKNNINDKISYLNEIIYSRQDIIKRGGLTQEKMENYNCEINALNDRISELNSSIADINQLGNDKKNIYILNNNGQLQGNVFKNQDGKISINVGIIGLMIHEIKHVSQSLDAGRLEFNKENMLQYYASGIEAQIKAEIAAYKAQFSYNGYFPIASFWSPNDITPQMIGNIRKKDGSLLYPGIYNFYNTKK